MFELWDTIGQDRFRANAKNLIKKSQGFIVIYDITKRKTFNEVRKFIETVIDETSKDALIIIVGPNSIWKIKEKYQKKKGLNLLKNLIILFLNVQLKII